MPHLLYGLCLLRKVGYFDLGSGERNLIQFLISQRAVFLYNKKGLVTKWAWLLKGVLVKGRRRKGFEKYHAPYLLNLADNSLLLPPIQKAQLPPLPFRIKTEYCKKYFRLTRYLHVFSYVIAVT